MTIGDETREIRQGDLVHIPPNEVHSLRPTSDHAPIHCFCSRSAAPTPVRWTTPTTDAVDELLALGAATIGEIRRGTDAGSDHHGVGRRDRVRAGAAGGVHAW